MENKTFTLAVLDEASILVGYEKVASADKWVHTKNRYPVPNGCDLAVGRYRLMPSAPGKFKFEPIRHEKDAAVENLQADVNIIPVLARIAGGKASDFDRKKLEAYLQTLDAQG